MTSWSSYPPRRSSRSRSPDRRGPPGPGRYSDLGPAPYDRGGPREWEKDRDPWFDDRPDWDLRRGPPVRGRTRSPAFDDDRRKRRRSPSPFDRDRYGPGPRYGDEYDYGRPHGPYSPPHHPPRRNGPPDPWSADSPVSFRVFSDWFRMNYPGQVSKDEDAATTTTAPEEDGPASEAKNPMKARYEDYKKKMNLIQLQVLFDFHRSSPWFKERYDPAPEFVALRTRVRKDGWKGKIDEFVQRLEIGEFDPQLDLPDLPATTTPAAAASGGEDVANPDVEMGGLPNDDIRQDDEMDAVMFDSEQVESNGVGKLPAAQRSERAEEATVQPDGNQIMIRTIPPDIGRHQLEHICKELPGFVHLALGDPMQKRNYYRCGWIKLADEADMSETVKKLGAAKVDGFKLHVMQCVQPFTAKVRSTPPIASEPERAEKDLQNMKTLAGLLESQAFKLSRLEPEDESPPAEMDEHDFIARGSQAVERHTEKLFSNLQDQQTEASEEVLSAKRILITMDLYLAYLRNAFNCCYYCAAIADHHEELLRKCIKHVRTPYKSGSDWKDERWTSWLDAKAALLTNRDGVDPTDYGGKDVDQELSRATEPHIKKEEESKFRCKSCNKLFKGVTFVEKHIANKHPEVLSTSLDMIPYFNNFALDPHRIQPFTHYPSISGGGQQPPPQAFGLRSVGNHSNGPDMSRMLPPPTGGHPYPMLPPHMGYNGMDDPYAHYPPPPPYARRRSPPRRRLSERLSERSDYESAPLNISKIEGLPQKPVASLPPETRRAGRSTAGTQATPARAPVNVKEDPRAASGRKVSYHDMDEVAEGDVELMY